MKSLAATRLLPTLITPSQHMTRNQQLIARFGAMAATGSLLLGQTTAFLPEAKADLSASQVQQLNPRSRYSTCPTDTDCYVLNTRIISGQVTNRSESWHDENYILPIWAIIDGMGVNAFPGATRSDDFFRVNVAKRTQGNMGAKYNHYKERNLYRQAPGAFKLHRNSDIVVPISRDKWTTEGLIFSVNMMEKDRSKRGDIDRIYFQTAKNIQSRLLRNATSVRTNMQSPTYYGDATLAALKFTQEAIPIAAKGYAAYQTGGTATAVGSVDITQIASIFKNLWNGIKRLDRDDVGEQKTIFIPFKSLANGQEKRIRVCGKVDKGAWDDGRFCVRIAASLKRQSRKSTPSEFDRYASNNTDNRQPGNRQPGNSRPPVTGPTSWRCEAGERVGRFALKSELNGKYVRAGIGRRSLLGAVSNQIGGDKSWETFDIYDLGNKAGLNGGTYALRSTQDPNRWVTVSNNNQLRVTSGCTTGSKHKLFLANRMRNMLQLQSLKHQKWIIQRSDNMLYGNARTAGGNAPRALQFRMQRIR